jgi:tRNA(adenine34) deaminase
MDLAADTRLNHRFPVERGLREEECGALLKEFFRARRGGGAPGGLGNGS